MDNVRRGEGTGEPGERKRERARGGEEGKTSLEWLVCVHARKAIGLLIEEREIEIDTEEQGRRGGRAEGDARRGACGYGWVVVAAQASVSKCTPPRFMERAIEREGEDQDAGLLD